MNRWNQVLWIGVLAGLAGCSPKQYAEQADRTAYTTLTAGQKIALGKSQSFDVLYHPFTESRDSIQIGKKRIPLRGDQSVILTLDEALEIAFGNSRTFQNRKETLFSSALTLANESRQWNWTLLAGALSGEASHTKVNRNGETNVGAAEAGRSWLKRFVHGGVLTLGYTISLATEFTGWNHTLLGSLLDANFTQPLLRGAWRGFAYEGQYRLERDFLFAVFDYHRFTQTFAVDMTTRYYGVLLLRDRLENERSNIKRLEQTLKLTTVLVKGGHASRIEQDQSEQNLLDARARIERNRQNYLDSLDRFKLTLGLPVPVRIKLNYPGAIKALGLAGPKPIPLKEPEAIAVALAVRPDVLTERAKVRDAARDLEISADQFNPQIDLEVGVNAAGTGDRQFHRTRFDRHTRYTGLTFDYDLDQTDNRDAYRNALIAHAKAQRDYDAFVDQVRIDIRSSRRRLVQSRNTYEIQGQNVKVALRRRRLAAWQQKGGSASARDVLEAEEALRNAQNGLTSALIDYTTTRLAFLADLGMLWVDEKGKLHERTTPDQFDRLKKRYPYIAPR